MSDKQMLTFEEFIQNWNTEVLPKKPKHIRPGQALMGYLRQIWPEEYNRLSSVHYYDRTDIDCYYRDELIPNTLKHLGGVWQLNTPPDNKPK